jgi:hypothetical protein
MQTYMAIALAAALTKGSPTLSHTTCLGLDKKANEKGTSLRAKVTKAQSVSHREENLLKCAHNAIIKAIIGLKTVNPNIMLMEDL